MNSILGKSSSEAKIFFLKESNYYNFDLPHYFHFQNLIDRVSSEIGNKQLQDICGTIDIINEVTGDTKTKNLYPCDFENVNYKFINNKDGKYAWRPLQLIHPVLYVLLVNAITQEIQWEIILNRFSEFTKNEKIRCLSLPLESDSEFTDRETSIKNWWQEIEQKSIELALKYEYILHSDILDCYGSIYTHSVAWAIHTKELAKEKRNDPSLIGNQIDRLLMHMTFGQTNGIPQGSILMDFIAEMILGFADLELTKKINYFGIVDYEILRYRDDYRIFTNNPQDAEKILKLLTEILIDLGMKITTQKMLLSNDIIRDSIKPDKLFWIVNEKIDENLQSQLLIINEFANKHSNSGGLNKILKTLFDRVDKIGTTDLNFKVLISIIVDIAYKSPRTYPISSAIISKLLTFISDETEKKDIIDLIIDKFSKIPNTGHLLIWLQRITLKNDRLKVYDEKLCNILNDSGVKIWNNNWLNNSLILILEDETIINEIIIENMDDAITIEEVATFSRHYSF